MASNDEPLWLRRTADVPDVPVTKPEDEEDGEAKEVEFGRVGNRQVPTVTFERRDGSGFTFAYGHFYRFLYADKAKLVVEFSEHVVTVEGSGAVKLRRYLADFRARVVKESDTRPGFGEGVVETITVVPRKG